MQIKNIEGYEVLDSRGHPTVEVKVRLEDGSVGRAIVPSGASTGMREAVELRDQDPQRYKGRGVKRAVHAVNTELREALVGRSAFDQAGSDATMIELDATPNKHRLGANALLGTSLAIAKAAAASQRVSFYRYVGGSQACLLPVPMINIINGGAHADNPIDFQEFMIVPVGAPSFTEAVRMGSEVFHTLRTDLVAAGFNTNVGDEGGFAPDLRSATQALDLIMRAIEKAGFRAGVDIALAIDPAASEFYSDDIYHYSGEGIKRTRTQQVAYLTELVRSYPLISIEDGMAENDIEGWQRLTEALGSQCQLVGDDVFCTDPTLLQAGIDTHVANAILVKPNQIGTLSETLQTVRVAQHAGYRVVMSHRSGETEDVSIADLAVATQCGQIKTGSISRADRTAKYNQLIRIERELGQGATYPGRRAFR